MPLQTLGKAHNTILNKFDQVLSNIFLMAKINYWLGFSDTHALFYHSLKKFIHSLFFLCLVFVFCFFSCSVSNSRFQLQIFVPSNSALKPFWGSSTYHTDNFFIQQQQQLSRSWFRRYGADFFLILLQFERDFPVFLFLLRMPNLCALEEFSVRLWRTLFCELVVQFVTYLYIF